MAAIQSNEPIGKSSRLAVARLGASRLGGIPRSSQLTSVGNYAWVRSDGSGSAVNHGQNPAAVQGGWTTGRS